MIRLANGLILLLTLAALCGCNDECVEGEGPRIEYTVTTDAFSAVSLHIPATITLYPDTIHRVIARSQENIAEQIDWSVSSGQLEIVINECLSDHGDIEIDIYTPLVQRIELNGIGDFRSGFLMTQDRLDVQMKGSGDMELVVDVNQLNVLNQGTGNIKVSGESNKTLVSLEASGDIKGFDLVSDSCYIRTIASGHSEVRVNDYLSAEILGSGDIRYKGTPVIDQEISGSGTVIDAN